MPSRRPRACVATALYHVRALHRADGRPHQYESRWLHPDAAPDVLDADLDATPIDEWLLQYVPFSRAAIGIAAVPAEGEPARLLEAPPGGALLLVERTTWKLALPLGFLQLFHHPGYRIATAI